MSKTLELAPAASRTRKREPLDRKLIRRLALLRYHLRQFLHFSERAARASGITPQQHQLLLGIAGHTGRDWANISELAEFLQERHSAVVGLVERAAKRGLVRKVHGEPDRRFVCVHLAARGVAVLAQLSALHQGEVARLSKHVLTHSSRRRGSRQDLQT